MERAGWDSLVATIWGQADYGVWVSDNCGVSWWLWLGKEEVQAVQPQPKAAIQAEAVPMEVLDYSIAPPVTCAIRVVVHGECAIAAEERERLGLHLRMLLLEELAERQQCEHDRWLQGLRAITSSLDLNELLLHIMHNALTVIPSVDCGFFMMMDPADGILKPKASVGVGEAIYSFQAEEGQGITGKVFSAGKGQIYNNQTAIDEMDNVTDENRRYLSTAFHDRQVQIRAVMAVPVTMNSDRIGVMLVHQLSGEKRPLSERDLDLLQGFADQAAIAIANARMYAELMESNHYLMKRNEIHDVFTKLAMVEDNFSAVIATVGRLIEQPCAFVDLATNEWYPKRDVELAAVDLFQSFSDTVDPVRMTIGGKSYYLYPIVSGSLLLGCFALELKPDLRPLDHIVLEQGGAVVALKMMNTYSATEMYYRRSREFFNELIAYQEPKRVMAKLKGFGLPAGMPLFVCVLQLLGENQDLKKRDIYLRQLIARLEKELGQTNKLLFGSHDKVTIIAAAQGAAAQMRTIAKLRSAVEQWSTASTPGLCGGIGGLYAGLEQVARSSEEASRTLSFLLRRGRTGISRYEEIGVNRLFLNQEPSEIETYIDEVLAPLRSAATPHTGELERTLKLYMAENRCVASTAEQLHIHPNTLYHRLRKIEEMLEIRLNDPDDWLKVYLACHLSETY